MNTTKLKETSFSDWPEVEKLRLLEQSVPHERMPDFPEPVLDAALRIIESGYTATVVNDPVRWGWGVFLEHPTQGWKLVFLENHPGHTAEDGKAMVLLSHLMDKHQFKEVPCCAGKSDCPRCEGAGYVVHANWNPCGRKCPVRANKFNPKDPRKNR